MADYEHILIERDEALAIVTVNRPAARNALNLRASQELRDALDDLETDREVGVVILTGAGDKSFVAGADLGDLRQRSRDDGFAALNSKLFATIERFPRPTIAAVNGHALGGGCELALACDIRVAAASARFGQPEVRYGIIPGAGGTQRLPRVVGLGWAKHLVLTGEIIDASRALAIGLVTSVVPDADLMPHAREIARGILRHGRLAARLAKIALNASARADLDTGLVIESLAQTICYQSDDKVEGTTAFLEKRTPRFTDR